MTEPGIPIRLSRLAQGDTTVRGPRRPGRPTGLRHQIASRPSRDMLSRHPSQQRNRTHGHGPLAAGAGNVPKRASRRVAPALAPDPKAPERGGWPRPCGAGHLDRNSRPDHPGALRHSGMASMQATTDPVAGRPHRTDEAPPRGLGSARASQRRARAGRLVCIGSAWLRCVEPGWKRRVSELSRGSTGSVASRGPWARSTRRSSGLSGLCRAGDGDVLVPLEFSARPACPSARRRVGAVRRQAPRRPGSARHHGLRAEQ